MTDDIVLHFEPEAGEKGARHRRQGKSFIEAHHLLQSLFSHVYLLFVVGCIVATTAFFSEEEAILPFAGLSEVDVINYLAFSSVFVLAGSMLVRWTFPVVPEEGLILFLVWIIYGNVFRKTCLCCSSWSMDHELHVSNWLGCSVCAGPVLGIVYSCAWFVTMLLSYSANLRPVLLARVFGVLAVVVAVVLLMLPNKCNQFAELSDFNLFLKITLFHITWHVNRTRRLQEKVLMSAYVSFAWHPRVVGKKTVIGKNITKHMLPANLFARLRVWYYKKKFKLKDNKHQNLFRPGPLSWKNRRHSESVARLFEVLTSIWVLGSCGWFVFGTLVQLIWLLANVHWNSAELAFVSDEQTGLLMLLSNRNLQKTNPLEHQN